MSSMKVLPIALFSLSVVRLVKIKEWIDANDPGAILIPFSGALELRLADMEPEAKAQYIKDSGISRYVCVCVCVS